MNPRVADRKAWAKFGLEANNQYGPNQDTTTVGENVLLMLRTEWREDDTNEAKKLEESMRDKLRQNKVRCRICEGGHFTARCPFKDTMSPAGEDRPGLDSSVARDAAGAGNSIDDGQLGSGAGGYVPPHLRKGGAAMGERMDGGSKYERDDLATLRVTNVSSLPRSPGLCADSNIYRLNRFPSLLKKGIFARFSSALVELREYFWQKIGSRDGPKVSLLSALLIESMRKELAKS